MAVLDSIRESIRAGNSCSSCSSWSMQAAEIKVKSTFRRSKASGSMSYANQLVSSCCAFLQVDMIRPSRKVVFLFPTRRARIWSPGIDSTRLGIDSGAPKKVDKYGLWKEGWDSLHKLNNKVKGNHKQSLIKMLLYLPDL